MRLKLSDDQIAALEQLLVAGSHWYHTSSVAFHAGLRKPWSSVVDTAKARRVLKSLERAGLARSNVPLRPEKRELLWTCGPVSDAVRDAAYDDRTRKIDRDRLALVEV